MTLTVEPDPRVSEQATAPVTARPSPYPASPDGREGWPVAVALTVTLVLVFLLGFAAYLFAFSGLAEARHQNTLLKTFRTELGQAVAPTGPVAEGKPVALVSIPRLHLTNVVVVEGTTSRDLTAGPGHYRSSPLPGQQGTSVLFGTRTTSGAPFAHLLDLQRGDVITTTTGQGVARYRVTSFGTTKSPAPQDVQDALLLASADRVLNPTGSIQVSAVLIGSPLSGAPALPAVSSDERVMQGDSGALVPLLLWSQALLLVAAAGTVGFLRWNRWAAVFCALPLTLAVLWNVYANLSASLPNVL